VLWSLFDLRPAEYGLPSFGDWLPNPSMGHDPVLPLDPPVRMGGPVVKGYGRGSKVGTTPQIDKINKYNQTSRKASSLGVSVSFLTASIVNFKPELLTPRP